MDLIGFLFGKDVSSSSKAYPVSFWLFCLVLLDGVNGSFLFLDEFFFVIT